MEAKIDKGYLVVRIPIETALRSSKPPKPTDKDPRVFTEGKNLLLANSGGFQGTTLVYEDQMVKINVCAIIPNPTFEASVVPTVKTA